MHFAVALPLAGTLLLSAPSDARGGVPTPEIQEPSLSRRVNEAVEKGIAWLRQQQNEDGSFRGHHAGSYAEGVTALALLALLKSSVSADDPVVRKGIEYLRYREFRHTYSTGVLLLLLDALGRKEYDDWAGKAAEWLIEKRNKNDRIWAYPDGSTDLSNTQYAILGLRAAARRGAAIPGEIWVDALEYLLRHQHDSGGFSYRSDRQPSGSMTLAGLAIALISLEEGRRDVRSANRLRQYEKMVDDAFDWYEHRYAIEWNPIGDAEGRTLDFLHYYLFSLERIGIFTGSKQIAGHDWYREGAEYLLAHQNADGSWKASTSHDSTGDTSFALLFLRRATVTLNAPRVRDKDRGTERRGEQPATDFAEKARLANLAVDPDLLFIRDWLTLGPFDDPDDTALEASTIRERTAAPSRGSRQAGKVWQLLTSDRDFVDLQTSLGSRDQCVGYAFCWLHALRETEALLLLGSDDAIKVVLNGETIHTNHMLRTAKRDEDRVPVRLEAGTNRLLLKVKDYNGAWGFFARISSLEGHPLPIVAPGIHRRFDEKELRDAQPITPLERGLLLVDVVSGEPASTPRRSDPGPGHGPAAAFDGNHDSWWEGEPPEPASPQQIGIAFEQPRDIASGECFWLSTFRAPATDGFDVEYRSGSSWFPVRDLALRRLDGAHWIVDFDPVTATGLRLVIRKTPPDDAGRFQPPALRELRLFRRP
jgi:hypothetical protein